MISSRDRLLEAVGAPELRWIWLRAEAQIRSGKRCTGKIRLGAPSSNEREAFARLFGYVPRGEGLTVSLPELETLLRSAGLAKNLAEAVHAVLGVDAEAVRQRDLRVKAEWNEILSTVGSPGREAQEHVAQVMREAVESGLLRRLSAHSAARAQKLLDQLMNLFDRLPARGIPLAQLAAEIAGDAHALDDGAPLGTLGLRLAARMSQLAPPEDTESRREVWARAGVLCDELSAPVLALNLQASGDTRLEEVMRLHRRDGEPMRISVRQLIRKVPQFNLLAGQSVFIFENPTVLAAAANRLATAAAPMLCTEGMPKTASHLLVDALVRAGAVVRFHVDFDWAGLRIGNLLAARHGATPWRMSLADYLGGPAGPGLGSGTVEAQWDAELAPGMAARGAAVHEESLLKELLDQLAHRT